MESEQNAVRRLLAEIKELRDEIEAANRCHEELTEALQLRDAELANLIELAIEMGRIFGRGEDAVVPPRRPTPADVQKRYEDEPQE